MKDVVGHSMIGRTNRCRKMQAAVSYMFDEEWFSGSQWVGNGWHALACRSEKASGEKGWDVEIS